MGKHTYRAALIVCSSLYGMVAGLQDEDLGEQILSEVVLCKYQPELTT